MDYIKIPDKIEFILFFRQFFLGKSLPLSLSRSFSLYISCNMYVISVVQLTFQRTICTNPRQSYNTSWTVPKSLHNQSVVHNIYSL